METITTDLHGNITDIQISVQLVLDNGQYVAYSPALEFSSYGDTKAEARCTFDEALQAFKQDVAKRKTLDELLVSLGWHRHQKATAVIYNWTSLPEAKA